MRSAPLLLLVLLLGCQYGPLDLQDNQPRLADAVIERDITLGGTSFVVFRENSGGVGALLCTIEQEIRGWDASELNDDSCIGCQDTYTLGLVTVDSDCDFGTASSADIAFTDRGFFEQSSDDANLAGWLDDNESDGYLNTTWDLRGPADWAPRMGVWRDETPNAPQGGDGPGYQCENDVCAQTLYWYGTADWYARWWIDLEFQE